jgi:glyoxylase-like metal-dependent hydrolase (beta-lactamase superfamily II)
MNDSLSTAVLEDAQTPPVTGTLREVAPRVHWLRMPLPFALDHVNLWLLEEDAGFTLVDCGYGNATTRAHWQQLFDGPLARSPIHRIVVTHCHPDHLGNATWLAARFGCPIFMTFGEFVAGHGKRDEHSGYGLASVEAHFARHGMPREQRAALHARGNTYRVGVPEVPRTFTRLIAGDRLDIGHAVWRVITGYGHSPEHAALACESSELLISGDMLLPKISTNVSVWPNEPEGDPVARFLDSLRAFEALSPATLVLPSHGPPFRGIAARVARLRAHHAERLDELHRAIVAAPQPQSAHDVLPVLFRRKLDLQQTSFAMGEAIAHLNCLCHAGRVRRIVADDGSVRFAA